MTVGRQRGEKGRVRSKKSRRVPPRRRSSEKEEAQWPEEGVTKKLSLSSWSLQVLVNHREGLCVKERPGFKGI